MAITLLDLSNNELQIYNQAGYQQRYTGVRLQDHSSEWLFKDYQSIHNEYLKLHEQSNDHTIKIEALKRLIYLNWGGSVEPKYFTGIDGLDERTIFRSYEILDDYINGGQLDKEFKWMLSYYSSWDFEILKYSEGKLHELTNFVKTADTSGSKLPESIDNEGMSNRGQMGVQWIQLIETSKRLKSNL